MDLIELGAQMLNEKLGLDVDTATIQSALSSLMGNGEGGIDLQGLVSQMSSSGQIGNLVQSWLSDGDNLPISADAIAGFFGEGKLDQFASAIGTSSGNAAGGLAEVIPSMLDKGSSAGNLLDSLGGADDLIGLAKGFLS
jgi:uncharacterized protein YidB (DUF937 family)